jgi:hypothetical protein
MDINKVKYNFDSSDQLIPWCPKCRKQLSAFVVIYDLMIFNGIVILAILAIADKADGFFFSKNVPLTEEYQHYIMKNFFIVCSPLFFLLAAKIIFGFRWWFGSKNSRKEF